MRYKEFGKTSLKVSEVALGTWGIGGAGWDDNQEETRLDAIRSAVECGINLIDTAPAYNSGVAERYIGSVLKDMGVREKMIITTKCGTEFIDGAYVRNCAPEAILRQCEESLRNLQTDYIDLYLIHWPDASVPIAETMETLNQLKRQGKIRHIGVSNFGREQIEEAGRYGSIEVYQPQYSMVFRSNEEQMKWACGQGMGVMTYGSLGAGILTGAFRQLTAFAASDNRSRFYKHFQEPMFSKVMKVVEVMDRLSAERNNVPLSQIALNWCAQKSFVGSCIVGAQSRRKVEENCAGFEWMLTEKEVAALDAAIEQYLEGDA
ncbi:aldo/keto reductase [uncultured Oscillibacter sp.]|uniref:aldo/keto reductase n=1 Tax=uncultured Oscillibacter sp. TaxID=876091 RepID=UPI00266EB601|nr:aldo/keto reductase [uncultured Oscillibacter sp.]